MIALVHAISAATAMLTIAVFWISTIVVEVFLGHGAVQSVKHFIAWGLLLLVPAMAATGGTGFALSKGRIGRLQERKKRRMPIIAINGIAVMIPAALFLNVRAAAGNFDFVFYAVQVLELGVGAVQLTLMGLNFRDGLKFAGRIPP
jgi:hypothetical protein